MNHDHEHDLKKAAGIAQFIAAGFFVFAGVVAFGIAVLTADTAISGRQFALMAGFIGVLIGFGGVFSEFASKHVLLRPGSVALKLMSGGAIVMLGAIAAK